MHIVISTVTRTERTLLALSLACFALAGVVNTSLDVTFQSGVAMTVAVAGVYGFALYARSVNRSRLARLSLGLWIAFLAVTPVHLVDAVAVTVGVARFGSVPADVTAVLIPAATWAMLLGACTSTAFLAFREYGAQTGVDTPEEQALDQDFDF